MSLHDKRLVRQMRDPVRGVFRKTGHDVDRHYKQKPIWLAHEEFPILVDRSDPSRFVVLWDEAETAEWKEHEQQMTQAAGLPPDGTDQPQ
jgi:hypothetical protein